MKKLLLLLTLHFLSASEIDIPTEIRQLLVVSVNSATQNQATLHAYERDNANAPWNFIFDPIPVTLGRNGLGVGLGLHKADFNKEVKLINKVEGDGKSPAGIFKLTKIFGYAPKSINNKMPYMAVTKTLHCVDDSTSQYYNKIIHASEGYKSFEVMRRKDDLYKWGIVVEHNQQAQPKRGSCIFIHIRRKDSSPTAGCTAMSEENLLKIIRWLDQKKNPTLLQYLTQKEFQKD